MPGETVGGIGQQFNYDNNYFRMCIVALAKTLNKSIRWINYFKDEMNQLTFYIESYNASKFLGENKNFLYTYYIETERGNEKLENFERELA